MCTMEAMKERVLFSDVEEHVGVDIFSILAGNRRREKDRRRERRGRVRQSEGGREGGREGEREGGRKGGRRGKGGRGGEGGEGKRVPVVIHSYTGHLSTQYATCLHLA